MRETTAEIAKKKMRPDQDCDDRPARDFSGASVYYNEYGDILKISLPTDFSLACITGLVPGTTPQEVVAILRDLGFNIDSECVRILEHSASAGVRATAKVEDPTFAKELSVKLQNQQTALSATPMPIDARRTNCRKVYISWHKATQGVWLNFGNGEIANRVAQRFNEGTYTCLGQSVKSSAGKNSQDQRGGGGFPYNPVSWTIILSDVPNGTTVRDIQESITLRCDRPRHIEVGVLSYQASHAEVSVEVRSRLEEHGPLENFYLAPTSTGKRVKATAWFQDEADARSACSLNNKPLTILGKGNVTVTLVQSAKIKVLTTIYLASKARIGTESITWREQHLAFRVYTGTLYTTLKVEGDNMQAVANARRTLEEISIGVVLEDGGKVIWDSALNTTGSVYKKLKSLERDLSVVIVRDKSKRQLRFHGPSEKLQLVIRQIADIIRTESSTSYEIDLKPHQFSWTINGGFKSIVQALGNNVAVFNVVSKRIVINGTQQQYEAAMAIMDGKPAIELRSSLDGATRSDGCCPICFCEADTPIQTSCEHTYCIECFEGYCKSAASTSKKEVQIKCQGGGGTCPTIFTLRELENHVSSSVFEAVLKSFFEDYIQRHPETFRYCPTPDCGHIYRCTTSSGSKPAVYTCSNCFERLCTSCHERHGDYTCAEFKDIASGGHAALERLKRELNIKDCPKCMTPMEKTEGCNHMTCGGCRAHICWVCMKVFEASAPCHSHMNEVHGGIGLGLDHLRDW
ncbi:hypothetical protein PV08_11402 [Exophiala spinifera]|uniref:RBR-type E3 ubiquitin transferase n=1 Tax=Exophiala spinifera TaxID=91928 RepID=A0A0D2AUN1_9EURO|nr:uncharacterized protein PV08_11402 [Exophiala spinifera]KIW10438.1 hypothetical protein PV08_11402 [Exophiala spinifera]